MNTKIFIVPEYIEKEKLETIISEKLNKKIKISASVEAEYGKNVIKGDIITLAHHTKEFENCPAPCNNKDATKLPEGSIIVVSHIDLDTVGGCLALIGEKPEDHIFWSSAEYIDVNGPQFLYKLDPIVSDQIEAFMSEKSKEKHHKYEEIEDVTDEIKKWSKIIKKIINKDEKLLLEGREYKNKVIEEQENCFYLENENYRIFFVPKGKNVFCNSAYYSPKSKKLKKCCITFNENLKTITLSFEDGGKRFSAREVVQGLWGSEAGGHAGIAGSPRGKEMNLEDLNKIMNAINKLYQEI